MNKHRVQAICLSWQFLLLSVICSTTLAEPPSFTVTVSGFAAPVRDHVVTMDLDITEIAPFLAAPPQTAAPDLDVWETDVSRKSVARKISRGEYGIW